MDTADDGSLLWCCSQVSPKPGHLGRVEAGVDGVLTLAVDDRVGVERDEMNAAKIERIVRGTEKTVEKLPEVYSYSAYPFPDPRTIGFH